MFKIVSGRQTRSSRGKDSGNCMMVGPMGCQRKGIGVRKSHPFAALSKTLSAIAETELKKRCLSTKA